MGRSAGRWGRRLLLSYALLLAASHLVRLRQPEREPGPDVRTIRVQEVEGARRGERSVRLVWREDGPGDGDAAGLPVLFLHGSPGSARDLAEVARVLASKRRTLRPDLPGFGESQRAVADYSVAAHADYALQLLDAEGIERVHLVGFSMGGGVALELAARAPERVASLALVSAIGVQELELLGDYHLNHALHGLQLALLWAAYELVPHFGLFDGSMLSVEYARNFYDTDQRPLRGALAGWEGPALVFHGRGDVLVPFAAAEEHHRVVPQSELVVLDGNHFLVFVRGDEVGAEVGAFLDRVEAGGATERAGAAPERIAAAAEPFDAAALPPLSGFSLVVLLLVAAAATLVSEDLTCIVVGALVGYGRVPFLPGAAACFVGIYVGDILLFLAGRWVGRRALHRAPLRWFLSEARVERSSAWFRSRGPVVVFLSRFMPGLRLPTYFAAGVLRTSFWSFSFWFALAAGVWTPTLVWLAAELGGGLEHIEVLQSNLAALVLVALAVGFVFVKLVRPALTHRGRRLLVGRWRRLVRWEYWPPWVFYGPVVLACVGHALRTRRPFAFTAANPGIPHGGFVGESKAAILAGLGPGGDRLPVSRLLSVEIGPEERLAAARELRAECGLPLVLKPDVGQRGDGVCVLRTDDELEEASRGVEEDSLLQEYVDGEEYGLFYARRPDEERGRLLSITEKRLPEVEGDGHRTLEELVLDDDRAVCMAGFFLDRNAARLGDVPGPGERVRIGELGTHCRGAAFHDGARLLTPELEAAVDELARSFPGFCFGRFDVRAESAEDLSRGRFRVLELNGVTSESAHVYDPRYGVLYGWRTIAGQWGLAYDVGLANARRGARTSTVGELVRALLDYRRRSRARSA